MQFTPFIIFNLISAMICALTMFYFTKKLNVKSKGAVIFLLAIMSLWALVDALELLYTDIERKLLLTHIGYIAYTLLTPCWFAFNMMYIARKSQAKVPFVKILFLISLFFTIINWFNPGNLFYTSIETVEENGIILFAPKYGILFWAYSFYSCITQFIILLWTILQSLKVKIKHTHLILLSTAIGIPVLLNILYVVGVFSINYTALGFMISCLFIFFLYKEEFFSKFPLSHKSIIDNMNTGYILMTSNMHVIELNNSAIKLLSLNEKYSTEQVENLIINEWKIDPNKLESANTLKQFNIASTQNYYRVTVNKIDFTEGSGHYFALFLQDETALHNVCERVRYLERYDESTEELYNQNYFIELLSKEISHCKTNKSQSVVLACIHILNYRDYCYIYGNEFGNLLIHAISRSLRDLVRSDDFMSRFSIDEICLFMNFENSAYMKERVENILERILNFFRDPIDVNGDKIEVKLNIGVAFAPKHADTSSKLINMANMARRNISKFMKYSYNICHENTGESYTRLLKIENDMHHAINRGQFHLMFQPQVDITNGMVTGVEALIRWKHPEFGIISPADFISIAEENGLIYSIGLWVIKESINQLKIWQDMGLKHLKVGVNVSLSQLGNNNFSDDVIEMLKASGVDSRFLELEITESIALFPEAMINNHLARLRKYNIRIAMDDFGMGHSSLGYIKEFEFDTIKIDRVLSNDILTNQTSIAMIRSVRMLCESLGVDTIVEFIEQPEQLTILKELKCNIVQGYVFSPPLSAEACTNYIVNAGVEKNK